MSKKSPYVPKPVNPAQARCPHRIRTRSGECSVCGSRKNAQGKWEYLNEDMFRYYAHGGPKPAGYASGRFCGPWTPSTYVSPADYRALERPEHLHPPHVPGRAFGRRRDLTPVEVPVRPAGKVVVLYGDEGEPTSWNRGSAKYKTGSGNAKIGQIDTTYVSIAATCVNCTNIEFGTCYTFAGQTASHVHTADALGKAWGETSLEASLHEAEVIDASYGGGKVPPKTTLRIHTIGDTSTVEGAHAVGGAVARWKARGGEIAYTYTHAWDRVPRAAFGKALSVIASLNPYDSVRGPMRNGYKAMSALVPVDLWIEKMELTRKARGKSQERGGSFAFRWIDLGPEAVTEDGRKIKFIPCPAQYPTDVDDKEGNRASYEAMLFKAIYIAKKLGFYPSFAELERRRVARERGEAVRVPPNEMSIKQIKDKMRLDFDAHGNAITEGHPFYERHRQAIVAAGLPDPMSEDFRVMMRKVSDKTESIQCVDCELCFDDEFLGRKGASIAFRPDKTSGGGLVAVENLFKKTYDIRDRLRSGELLEAPAPSMVRPVVSGGKPSKVRINEKLFPEPRFRVAVGEPTAAMPRLRVQAPAEDVAVDEEELVIEAKKKKRLGRAAGKTLTQAELNALRSVDRASPRGIWTITMTDEFHAVIARLADKGLVDLIPRQTRRGNPDGKDAKITAAGRAALSRGRP